MDSFQLFVKKFGDPGTLAMAAKITAGLQRVSGPDAHTHSLSLRLAHSLTHSLTHPPTLADTRFR